MIKKLFIITLLFLIFSFGLYKVSDNFDTFFPVEDLENQEEQQVIEENKEPLTQKEINQQIVADKIALLKNRYAQRGLILAGDDHLENNEYLDALVLYNTALKSSPTDAELITKVADTYFAMKKYDFAYKKYLEISDYGPLDKHNIWLSLIYSYPYDDENKVFLRNELEQINLEPSQKLYYDIMLNCMDDFHECKKQYQEQITGTGTLSEKMISISDAIEQYENFQIDELYFKDTLIIKALYDDQNYPFVISLGKDVLKSQSGYRPVIAMIAQSHFELGEYSDAKQYLNEAYELDNTDPQITYMLGVVNRELGEYLLSNILLNKSIENGYSPSIYPQRFIVNNYLDLEEPDKALQVFSELLRNNPEDITKDDLLLASYYNILYENLVEADAVIQSGLENFPEEADFYGFAGWMEKDKQNLVDAMGYLTQGYDLDPSNAMITLNIGQIALLEKDKSQATFYLKQTTKNDLNGQFGSVAQELLDEL